MELPYAGLDKGKRIFLLGEAVRAKTATGIPDVFALAGWVKFLRRSCLLRRCRCRLRRPIEAKVYFSQSGREGVATVDGVFCAIRAVQSSSGTMDVVQYGKRQIGTIGG